MRGALAFDGIVDIDIEEGESAFTVTHDPAKVDPERILAALEEAGESASLRE